MLIILFVLIRLGEGLGTAPGWVRGYGDDLLCLPLVLSLALTVRRLAGRPGRRTLPISHGLTAVVFFGVFFEAFLPRIQKAAVGDPWDLFMYLVGFLIFQGGLNPSARGVAVSRIEPIFLEQFFPSPPDRSTLEETWTPLKRSRPVGP
ncbi:MAG: hypothetical protein ABFS42_07460 [Candidatus Krumholzibacteriota bacterium]